MMMIIISEIHRSTPMFTYGTEENLNSHTSLESFRNKINSKMTFRQALNTISTVLRKRISSLEPKSQRQQQINTSQFLRTDTVYTNSIARETCHSPKREIMDSLMSKNKTVVNSDVVERFKFCKGKPVCRVSDIDYTRSGTNAKGWV